MKAIPGRPGYVQTGKKETGRQSHYSEGSDNVCVCVVFCLSLTHMLMSEAPRQKESCDGELLALRQFLSDHCPPLLSWPPSVTHQPNYLTILRAVGMVSLQLSASGCTSVSQSCVGLEIWSYSAP